MEIFYENGYYFIKNAQWNALSSVNRKKLLAVLTVSEKENDYSKPKTFYAFKSIPKGLAIPSNIVYKNLGALFKSITFINKPIAMNFHPKQKLELYPYQRAVSDHIMESFKSHPTFYLHMDTGQGKTKIAIDVICKLRLTSLVVTPTIDIGRQWLDEFKALNVKATMFSMKHNPQPEEYDVVVVVVNSLRTKDINFMNGYGLIVFDESHEYYTEQNNKIMWMIGNRFALALSASPNECDHGLDRLINIHLGNPIYTTDIPGFVIDDVVFKAEVRAINYYSSKKYGAKTAIGVIKQLINDEPRTQLILRETKKLIEEGTRGIFIFSEMRSYLDYIKHIFTINGIFAYYDDDSSSSTLIGGSNQLDLAKQKGAHIVLTTFAYGRRGISLPYITAIVFATPRRNKMNQIIGRILRRGSDHTIMRKIIDIIDCNTMLANQFGDRRLFYESRKYPIELE